MVYFERDCKSSDLKETGETKAKVTCPDRDQFKLEFNTSTASLSATVLPRRAEAGRGGQTIELAVRSANYTGNTRDDLEKAFLSPIDGQVPETAPLQTRFSGWAAVEQERTTNFGYDGTSAIPNFQGSAAGSQQSNVNFLSNLSFDISKDRTTLSTVLEVGEIYMGDSTSGGVMGGRQRVVELRNAFLSHTLSDTFKFKGGLLPLSSDPRGFVLSDHLGATALEYSTDMASGSLWYAAASKGAPGNLSTLRDEYYGLSGTVYFFNNFQPNLFVVQRLVDETVTDTDLTTALSGSNEATWAGVNFQYLGFDPISADVTAIGYWSKFSSFAPSEKVDRANAWLVDGKLNYTHGDWQTDFSLEYLATPGQKDAEASGRTVVNKRNIYSAPSPGAAYLLTLATSDFADDAPGSPKQSILANLNQREGLQIVVLKAAKNFTRRLTAFIRYGSLQSAVEATATASREMGNEFDLGAVYQVSPGTTFQFDYAQFTPGGFFASKNSASLVATKLKFAF